MVIGNIGNDPEMRFTPSGIPMTTFNIAVSRVYTTKDGERRRETEWFTVLTWNRLAETCNQFLSKGRRAYVEGRLRSRTWEGRDGIPRFRNEIIADKVVFLERPTVSALPEEEEPLPEESEEIETDDIHF